MGVKPSRIELNIEELMLDPALPGEWTPSALQALREEAARALAFLLETQGLPADFEQGRSVDVIELQRPVHIERAGGAEKLANSIAQAIYRSLSR
ncbi:hypothetical protein [Caldilinea sp.]|jgi:hypothetical protein|nr:hypothetical protein [Caldilinea sp.]GIV70545.1 MAG: hypothetical protein KatS3mg048_3407 [Caldilinea sp.]